MLFGKHSRSIETTTLLVLWFEVKASKTKALTLVFPRDLRETQQLIVPIIHWYIKPTRPHATQQSVSRVCANKLVKIHRSHMTKLYP